MGTSPTSEASNCFNCIWPVLKLYVYIFIKQTEIFQSNISWIIICEIRALVPLLHWEHLIAEGTLDHPGSSIASRSHFSQEVPTGGQFGP